MKFNITDQYPEEELNTIMPLSARARSWLARVNVDIPDGESIQAIGAVVMLDGLDYHHARFMKLMERLGRYFSHRGAVWGGQSSDFYQQLFPTSAETEDLNGLDHESIAYLNRLGQFHAYAKARGQASRLLKTRELMVFRNKHAAHRSIDVPKGESRDDQEFQAMAFGFYRITREGIPTYQIISNRKRYEFDMHRDHPVVMQEAIDVLFSVYPMMNGAE